MTAKRIEAVLRPASVAVVGASDTPGSIGEVLGLAGGISLVRAEHAGRVVVVRVQRSVRRGDALALWGASTVFELDRRGVQQFGDNLTGVA